MTTKQFHDTETRLIILAIRRNLFEMEKEYVKVDVKKLRDKIKVPELGRFVKK